MGTATTDFEGKKIFKKTVLVERINQVKIREFINSYIRFINHKQFYR